MCAFASLPFLLEHLPCKSRTPNTDIPQSHLNCETDVCALLKQEGSAFEFDLDDSLQIPLLLCCSASSNIMYPTLIQIDFWLAFCHRY